MIMNVFDIRIKDTKAAQFDFIDKKVLSSQKSLPFLRSLLFSTLGFRALF